MTQCLQHHRTTKELDMYKQETIQLKLRYEKMEENNEDEYEVRQQVSSSTLVI